MTNISLIAAIDKQRGIGKNNQLLCHLPADLHYFKETTMGKPIVMGRKTYESIGKPLPGRDNLVISQSYIGKNIPGIKIYSSLKRVIEEYNDQAEVFVIGGAQVFTEALPLAQCLYLTQIHHTFNADVFFPEVNLNQWRCEREIFRPQDEKNRYALTFYKYVRL